MHTHIHKYTHNQNSRAIVRENTKNLSQTKRLSQTVSFEFPSEPDKLVACIVANRMRLICVSQLWELRDQSYVLYSHNFTGDLSPFLLARALLKNNERAGSLSRTAFFDMLCACVCVCAFVCVCVRFVCLFV